MSNVKSALLVGVGGQGAILISKIMSNGFMQAGYDVKQSEVHGMAQRGGSVSTQVRWGDKVYGPVFGRGEADIMVALEKMEAVRYAEFLKPTGVASTIWAASFNSTLITLRLFTGIVILRAASKPWRRTSRPSPSLPAIWLWSWAMPSA